MQGEESMEKAKAWMEHRECFAYSVEKGCVSMTNAQKIRAMTDEELAVLIAREIVHVPLSGFYVAKSAWLRWLQETVEEQDG